MSAADWPAGEVSVRPATEDDAAALLEVNRASAAFHRPWVEAPSDVEAMSNYLGRCSRDDFTGLVALTADGDVVGTFNLSQIFRGGFQNAYLGFHANVAMAGRGLMAQGLARTLDYAFGPEYLHRVEANVQPGNERSKRLVERVGFRLEGFSPRYLHIDGAWRDHDRYAVTSEDWTGGTDA